MTHDNVRDYRKSMKITLIITFIFFLVVVAGGLLSGSLALISNAGHMFSDLLSLILSLGAITLALQFPRRNGPTVTPEGRSSQRSSTPCY
jgi:cobalt-zinc-cadmium efflux system protein